METIYKELCRRLQEAAPLFEQEGLQAVQHVDYWKGQYLDPEAHNAYYTPAVFFEIDIDWQDTTELEQKGTALIRIHVELENYAESKWDSEDQVDALRIFRSHQITHCCIHGMAGDGFTPLRRTRSEQDKQPGATNIHILNYRCSVEDKESSRYGAWVKEKLDGLVLSRGTAPVPVATVRKYTAD